MVGGNTDQRYGKILEAYERIIFGIDLNEKSAKMHARAKEVVRDFQRLVSVERGEALWARDWMLNVNIDISNPATLGYIGTSWRGLLSTISITLKDWEILIEGI
ncbi:MAG: hypothetical protein ACREHV_12630 [Rhizomicrobium sp.]